jgi:hypothetical protein
MGKISTCGNTAGWWLAACAVAAGIGYKNVIKAL